jgi:hypothetical protein
MIRRLALAALLALPLWTPVQPASAEVFYHYCGGFICRDDSTDAFSERNSTLFDLGIEVNNLPMTKPAVNQFMAGLSQRNQFILVVTCQRFLENSLWVKSRITLDFCETLLL